MLLILVAKTLPLPSLQWTISILPGCFSIFVITPILPKLLPAVIKIELPISNLIKSTILLVVKSNLAVSLISISGFGNLIVLASCVTRYGILFGPIFFYVTFSNLNCIAIVIYIYIYYYYYYYFFFFLMPNFLVFIIIVTIYIII